MDRRMRYTDNQIIDAIQRSKSFVDVMRLLGAGKSGSALTHMKYRILKSGFDIGHFHYNQKKPIIRNRKLTSTEILVIKDDTRVRTSAEMLRRALFEIGREYKCQMCEIGDEYNGQKITLQVDHINGLFYDNREENLRFLCPNCHTQTSTYGRVGSKRDVVPRTDKKRKRKLIIDETILTEMISKNFTYQQIADELNWSVVTVRRYCHLYGVKQTFTANIKIHIDRETLENLIKDGNSLAEIGRIYGLSQGAIRNRCKKFDIKYRQTFENCSRGRKWITNGIDDRFHDMREQLPDGWYFGKTNNLPPRKKTK